MQPLDPLGIQDVRLGAGTAVFELPRLDQIDFETFRFEQLKEGDPVDAGGFQGDRGDALSAKVGDDGLEIGGVGAEVADQAGADADDVQVGVDIDAGGVRMLYGERGGAVLQGARGVGVVKLLRLFQATFGHGGCTLNKRKGKSPRRGGPRGDK